MSTWWAVVPAVLAAIVVVLGPGLIALAPLRMPMIMRMALSGAASVFLIGSAGILFAAVGLPYAAWQPFALAGIMGLLILAVRSWAPRPAASIAPARWAIIVTWACSAAVIGVIAFVAVPSPDRISQTYDNVFHLSAIASILDHGNASSLTLRTLIETASSFGFYPAGWHTIVASVVQISGASVPIAVNASWLIVAAVLWLPGVAWLAQVILSRSDPTVVAMIALPVGTAFAAMPYALLVWGTLYPTLLATAVLPAAIAVTLVVARRLVRPGTPRSAWLWSVGALVVVTGAVAFGQPRVLASGVLLLLIPAVVAATGWVRRGWRIGGRRRRDVIRSAVVAGVGLLLGLAAAAWYLVFSLGLFTRPLDDRLGGPQARAAQSIGDGVWQVLLQAWPTGDGRVVFPALLLAAAMMAGAVVLLRDRRTMWVVWAFLLVAVMYVASAGSDDVVTKLATALWYKDKFRLSSLLPVLGVTIVTAGVLWAARRIRVRRHSPEASVSAPRPRAAIIAAWLVATGSAITLIFGGVSGAVGDVFRMPASDARGEVVSQTQIDFFASLSRVVPAGQRVLGDPWDGSAWTRVFGEREPVFPHVNGQWDADRLTVAWHLAEIDTNPEVCAALDRLDVRYVTYSPHEFGGGDPSGNHFPGPHQAVEAGLFTLVASDADTSLYRIDQCGPLTGAGHAGDAP